ncbi:MAG TPA: hypothetical protein VFQ61_08275 [Polyangiaceae bacterium]|nr:hypothetical protein [Polyangiaceae bacterium]
MSLPEGWGSLRSKVAAAALLLGIFVAGAFTGVAIYRWARHDDLHHLHPRPHPDFPKMLADNLDLSPAQEQQVREVFDRHRPELDAVFRETFPRVRAVQDSIDAEVRPLLNESQRQRFDEFKARANKGPFPPGPFHPGPPR